jgi:hypothetical protein
MGRMSRMFRITATTKATTKAWTRSSRRTAPAKALATENTEFTENGRWVNCHRYYNCYGNYQPPITQINADNCKAGRNQKNFCIKLGIAVAVAVAL